MNKRTFDSPTEELGFHIQNTIDLIKDQSSVITALSRHNGKDHGDFLQKKQDACNKAIEIINAANSSIGVVVGYRMLVMQAIECVMLAHAEVENHESYTKDIQAATELCLRNLNGVRQECEKHLDQNGVDY